GPQSSAGGPSTEIIQEENVLCAAGSLIGGLLKSSTPKSGQSLQSREKAGWGSGGGGGGRGGEEEEEGEFAAGADEESLGKASIWVLYERKEKELLITVVSLAAELVEEEEEEEEEEEGSAARPLWPGGPLFDVRKANTVEEEKARRGLTGGRGVGGSVFRSAGPAEDAHPSLHPPACLAAWLAGSSSSSSSNTSSGSCSIDVKKWEDSSSQDAGWPMREGRRGVPSGPRNVISVVNETSVILEWHSPRETGGRLDVVYNIVCKKCRTDRRSGSSSSSSGSGSSSASCSHCDDNVDFVPRQLGLTEARVFISNLLAHTLYSFEIQAVNGVSNRSPYPAQHVSIDITTNQAERRTAASPNNSSVHGALRPSCDQSRVEIEPDRGFCVLEVVGRKLEGKARFVAAAPWRME
ncbi:hypothetical protein CRUP_010633, partial [Coryphaenoides rupestris]